MGGACSAAKIEARRAFVAVAVTRDVIQLDSLSDYLVAMGFKRASLPCSSCSSSGFEPSVLGPDRCTFCDGTEGGLDPHTADVPLAAGCKPCAEWAVLVWIASIGAGAGRSGERRGGLS